MLKKVFADFDDEGIYVYQAFKTETVRIAVQNRTFSKGFGLERITWIKPSFGWILRRSAYASKHGMEAIARIKIAHENWIKILSQSVGTHWNSAIFTVEDDWQKALNTSDVIHQWDPDRDIVGRRLERQAIQIGIRGEVIKAYVREYIIQVEDISALAHKAGTVARSPKLSGLSFPIEREYPLDDNLAYRLGCSD